LGHYRLARRWLLLLLLLLQVDLMLLQPVAAAAAAVGCDELAVSVTAVPLAAAAAGVPALTPQLYDHTALAVHPCCLPAAADCCHSAALTANCAAPAGHSSHYHA
jgi:hypothetical protein